VGIGNTAPAAQLDVLNSTGSGTAINATSITGTGLNAVSVNGTGIQAFSATGAAVNIGSGALRVQGAGVNTTTTAFIQVETSTNAYVFPVLNTDLGTYIYNPICDGNPNAVLIVTHNVSASTSTAGSSYGDPVGVGYDPSNSHWYILDQNTSGNANMPLGTAFNVLVIVP